MKIKREQSFYMIWNDGDGDGFWNTYDSLSEAQDTQPDGTVIYVATLKPVGKTKHVLTEIKRNELAK